MENLQILFSGYGHWKITTMHYNKEICCTTNNASAIDDAKDGIKKAIKSLRKEIINKNKN
tara:strand:+ start:489 stop:668 length:180 start_codon:yes stop_codon:yes gene_type:complete